MRRTVMLITGLGAILALAGCSMAINGETRYRLHRAFANGSSVNPQLGDVSFKYEKDLFYSLTPLSFKGH